MSKLAKIIRDDDNPYKNVKNSLIIGKRKDENTIEHLSKLDKLFVCLTNIRGSDPKISKEDSGKYKYPDNDKLKEFFECFIYDINNGFKWALQEITPIQDNYNESFMFFAEIDGFEGDIKIIIDGFREIMKEYLIIPDKKIKYMVAKKTTENGKYHIYFPEISLSKNDAQFIAKKVEDKLGIKEGVIDMNYNGLRLLGAYKFNHKTCKYVDNQYLPYNLKNKKFRKLTPELMIKYSIIRGKGTKVELKPRVVNPIQLKVESRQEKYKNTPNLIEENGLEYELMEIVEKFYDDGSIGEPKERKNGFYVFDRLCSTYCKWCKRDHDNDRSIWARIVDGNKVISGCCKSLGTGEIIGIMPSLDPTETENNKKELNLLSPKFDIKYDENFVRKIDNNFDILLLRASLGRGKTTRIIEDIIIKNLDKKILFISPRRMFAKSITFDINKILPNDKKFDCYLDIKGDAIKSSDRLVIQVESLYKLENVNYNIIIIDECESILQQLISLDTHKETFYTNNNKFETLLQAAEKVIFADAFLSIRTDIITDLLLPDKNKLKISNEKKPNERSAYEYECFDDLMKQALSCLEKGEKIVFFCASKEKLDIFTSILENKKIKFLAYSGNRTTKIVDVKEEWSDPKIKCVIYTSTITVGINFDVKDIFNKLFVYGSACSSCVRDLFQSTMRVRHLIDNEMHYYYYGVYHGHRVPFTKEGVKEYFEKYSSLVQKIDDSIKESPLKMLRSKWHKLPEWMKENLIFGHMEVNLSKHKYGDVFEMYLKLNNYVIKKKHDIEEIELDYDIQEDYKYEEIKLISKKEYLEIKRLISCKQATPMQYKEYNKYRFRYYYIDNLSDDELTQELMEIFNIWKERGGVKKTMNVYFEKIKNPDRYFLDKKASKVYREIMDKQSVQLSLIKNIKDILQIDNTHEEDTIIKRSLILENYDKIMDMEENLRIGFDLRISRTKNKKESDDSKVQKCIDLINSVLYKWGTSHIVNGKRVRKKINEKIVNIPPDKIIRCEKANIYKYVRGDDGN